MNCLGNSKTTQQETAIIFCKASKLAIETVGGITVLVLSILAISSTVSGAALGWTSLGVVGGGMVLELPAILANPAIKKNKCILITYIAVLAILAAAGSILPTLAITGVMSGAVLGWINIIVSGSMMLGLGLLVGCCVGGVYLHNTTRDTAESNSDVKA